MMMMMMMMITSPNYGVFKTLSLTLFFVFVAELTLINPIGHRIRLKIAAITYKVLSTNHPAYLNELLTPYQPSCHLCSHDKPLLDKSEFNTYRWWAFSYAASYTWNSVPFLFQIPLQYTHFQRHLKAFYFSNSSE